MKKIKKIVYFLFFVFCGTLVFGSMYVKKIYPDVLFDELYFYLFNGVGNADLSLVINGFKICVPLILISSIVLYFVLYKMYLTKYISKKLKKPKCFKVARIILSILILFLSIFICMKKFEHYNLYKISK